MKAIIVLLLLVSIISCQNTVQQGDILRTPTDIVYIVDEGTYYNQQLQNWLFNVVSTSERSLSGTQQSNNRYGLVLFGGANSENGRIVSFMGDQLVQPDVFFINNIRQQFTGYTSAGRHDGYAAMNLALDLNLRPNAVKLFVFVTPNYRDIVDQRVTRSSIITRLKQQNIVLNVLVNATFVITELSGQPRIFTQLPVQQSMRAIGILFNDQIRNTYYINENNINTGINPMGYAMNGRIDAEESMFTVVDDYVLLVEQLARENCGQLRTLGGASFDIKFILQNTISSIWTKLFSIIMNLEVMFSSQTLPQPTPLPFPQPTPIPPVNPSPITTGCPPHSALFGNRLFFILEKMVSEPQAHQECQLQNGYLANITEENSDLLVQLTTYQISNHNVTTTYWVNSWDGNDYDSAVLLFFKGTITTPANPDESHYALCEVLPVPPQCNNVVLRG